MNKKTDAYLFGQILGTHSFLLKDGFLKSYMNLEDLYLNKRELIRRHFVVV